VTEAAAFLPGGGRVNDHGLTVVGRDGVGAIEEDT
jgi:hypothetical protein